jgi:hypothetical protein
VAGGGKTVTTRGGLMKRLLEGRGAPALIVGVLMVLAAGGGYALARGSRTIHACVQKGTHALYTGRCRKGDKKLSWSQIGPQGPRGQQGRQGVQGLQGVQGVAGTPATKFFATVKSDGSVDASSPGVQAASLGTGVYVVDFGQDISHCAASVTMGAVPVLSSPGTSTPRVPGYGLADLSSVGGTFSNGFPKGDTVEVETYNATSDLLADAPFHIAVFC